MPLDIQDLQVAPQSSPSPDAQISLSPEQKMAEDIKQEEQKMLMDFAYAKPYLNDMVTKWEYIEQKTEANRVTRDVDIDIDVLRENGDVEDDECFIPERIIDSNIQREMPSYINFLKNSRRIAIFNDKLDPTFDTQLLEDAFTKGMTYKGWTRPFFKTIDGAMTHGWSSVEVVYDPSKPLQCGIEYIAHEDLIFPTDSKDIQNSSCILRRYSPTPLQLKNWVNKFGFSLNQVQKIIEKYAEKTNKDKTVEVFKRFCKSDGVVCVAWFCLQAGCDDWLLAPKKAYAGVDELVDKPTTKQVPNIQMIQGQPVNLGMQEVQSTEKDWDKSDLSNYPIFLLPYKETEKPLVFDYLGRVFYDKDKQEAQTAIVTSFVNGINRAYKVYASPAADTVGDGKPAKQLANIKWDNGCIFDKPMQFWNFPYPDPMVLKALEYFDVSNSQDIGQTDFAATNRQDSRKTATEIKAAANQSSLLDSVDLTLFSEFCREVFSFCWLICRSRALQNQIKFLLVTPPTPQQPQGAPIGLNAPPQGAMSAPMPNAQPQVQGATPAIQSIVDALGSYQAEQSNYVNDVDTIIRDYDVRAAGDVDVIQKEEVEQQMMQDWPVISNTPLASRFLQDLVKLKYPQDGAVYQQILQEGNPKNAVIQSLGSLITEMLKMPEVAKEITPQLKQQLQQIQAEAQQALATP